MFLVTLSIFLWNHSDLLSKVPKGVTAQFALGGISRVCPMMAMCPMTELGCDWLPKSSGTLQMFPSVAIFKQKIRLILAVQLLTHSWQQKSEQVDLAGFLFFFED